MKKLGTVFRGQGEEQRYIYELGESEIRKVQMVTDLPFNVIEMMAKLHWVRSELNELLDKEPPK